MDGTPRPGHGLKLWVGLAILGSLLNVTEARARHPITVDHVRVGGAQSPASSAHHKWEGEGCRNEADLYIRWFVREVRPKEVFVERIFFSYRPNTNGEYQKYTLQNGDNDQIQAEYVGRQARPNETVSYSASVNKWVSFGRNGYIWVYEAYSAERTPDNAPYPCGERENDLYALELDR